MSVYLGNNLLAGMPDITGKANTSLNNLDSTGQAVIAGKVDLDLNNMNPSATAKETIVGWGMPDYSAGIDISNGNISSVYGWFYISGHSYSTTVTVSLNDSVVYTGANYGSERLSNTCILFVKPNDKISWAGWNSQVSMARIYPCIGVN